LHWKVWTFLATLAWTLWGVSVKYALQRIHWTRLEVLSALAGLIAMLIIAPSSLLVKFDRANLIGFIAGGLGAAGAILFYIAVSKGPVSVVIPITSLYVVGVAAVGILLLGEPLTWRKALGVACAAAAMALLAGET